MGTWIESHTTLRTHKKLKMLCDELEINRREAIGLLHCLWWWTIENRENGDLSELFDRDIAIACDWDGDAKKLVKALHKCEWLIDNKLKDWTHYVGRLLKDRERKRAGRNKDTSTDSPRTSPETIQAVQGQSKPVSSATVPYRTVPNSTVPNTKDKSHDLKGKEIKKKSGWTDENMFFLTPLLLKKLGYNETSEAYPNRLKELWEISKDKNIPVAYAMTILQDEIEKKELAVK